ncbi:cytochrome P450 26B1-like isoform X2 [Clavelina lepadiformis]|uniref:cytochrome P450 26B1-like isoform X2 n=1 Tax=Clavelina lepadiformis TaxID=159417 RepID=UPI004042F968
MAVGEANALFCKKTETIAHIFKMLLQCNLSQNETDDLKSTFLGYSYPHTPFSRVVRAPSVPAVLSGAEAHLESVDIAQNFNDPELLDKSFLNGPTNSTILLQEHSFLMSTFLLAVTLALILLLLWYPLRYWWRCYNLRSADDPSSPLSHLPLPPGSFGLPIIGETVSWITQGPKFNSNRRKKYGNVFKTSAITLPMVKVTGHEYVKKVLMGEHEEVTTVWPKVVQRVLGANGIVNTVGPSHKHKRRMASKAFTAKALNSYLPRLRINAEKNIKAMLDEERPRAYDRMLKLTFEFGISALLGFDLNSKEIKTSYNTFHDLVSNIFSMPYRIPGFGFDKAMNARTELLDKLQDQIRKKKEIVMEQLRNGEDVNYEEEPGALDIILHEVLQRSARKHECLNSQSLNNNYEGEVKENLTADPPEEPISDLALTEMGVELMFAGYYTSASALTSCILELSRNPKVFKKLENELLKSGILSGEDSIDENEDARPEFNLQAIQKLTYMEQVLKEAMRLRPPVLGGYRKAKRTFQIGPYRVPKGWYVIYNIRDTHEFEFENMDTFDPDRFAPGRDLGDNYRFIPFGGGPRTCVGRTYARLIIKLALIEMFRHFRKWELTSDKLPRMKAIPTLHPVDGLPLKLFPRERIGVVNTT